MLGLDSAGKVSLVADYDALITNGCDLVDDHTVSTTGMHSMDMMTLVPY